MERSVIILGAGGHGRTILDLLRNLGYKVAGFSDPDQSLWGTIINGIPVIGSDDEVLKFSIKEIFLALGVGGTRDNSPRKRLFEHFFRKQYTFPVFVHPSSIISTNSVLGSGSIVMAGSVIQTGCKIGNNVIVNTGAIVDHDCLIEDHVHIAPGAVLSGNVSIGVGAHVGTGATIIQNIKVGAWAVVGAGAVVVNDVEPNSIVMGVPAKTRERIGDKCTKAKA